MSPAARKVKAIKNYINGLSWAAFFSAAASIIGSWASLSYEHPIPVWAILVLTSAWAATCWLSAGLVRGNVITIGLPGITFLILALVSPAMIPLAFGILIGLLFYLCVLTYATANPKMESIVENRFYLFRHPLGSLVPLAYLAPQPLSPVFDPMVAFHWAPGTFNVPVLRISVFDPPSVHDYIQKSASDLSAGQSTWHEALVCFRQAMGLLNLLDALRKYEMIDLDGVALTASARLALAGIPANAREILREVLKTLKPDRRNLLMRAYDFVPTTA